MSLPTRLDILFTYVARLFLGNDKNDKSLSVNDEDNQELFDIADLQQK